MSDKVPEDYPQKPTHHQVVVVKPEDWVNPPGYTYLPMFARGLIHTKRGTRTRVRTYRTRATAEQAAQILADVGFEVTVTPLTLVPCGEPVEYKRS